MEWLLLDTPLSDPTTRWLLVVAVGMTIFYAVMRPLRKKKDPLERKPSPFGLASQRAVERDMSNLLVELSEMARQLTAQLDTRTLKLETLLKEADERIAELKAAGAAIPPASNGSGVSHESSPPTSAVRVAAAIDPRHLEIYELFDQNFSSQQISARLGRPRGEIDLILALRRKAESSPV